MLRENNTEEMDESASPAVDTVLEVNLMQAVTVAVTVVATVVVTVVAALEWEAAAEMVVVVDDVEA